jgi:hypothetical protein
MRRALHAFVLLGVSVLMAVVIAVPAASGAAKPAFPDKLKERYAAACVKGGAKQAFCDCMLVQFEKRMSLTQMVRYVVALEQKRKPSKAIIHKVTISATACIDSLA